VLTRPEKRVSILEPRAASAVSALRQERGIEYGYAVGKRVAERAQARLAHEVERQQGVQRTDASGAQSWDQKCYSGPVLVDMGFTQAGNVGSAVILSKPKQGIAGEGFAHLQKRRQKLTGKLLKDTMADFNESAQTVSWWWSVFEAYADAPVDLPLPAMPKKEDPPPLTLDEALMRRPSSPMSHTLSLGSRTPDGRRLNRLGGKSFLLSVPVKPKLRGKCRGPEPNVRNEVDEALWTGLQNDYRARKLKSLGLDAEELDLYQQCQTESLDFEKLELFADLYSAAAQAQKQAHESRSSTFGGNSGMDGSETGLFTDEVQRLKSKVFTIETLVQSNVGSSSASQSAAASESEEEDSTQESSSQLQSGPHTADAEAADGDPPFAGSIGEVMLRTSNTAMMKSRLWREHQVRSSKEGSKQSREQVLEQRTSMLRSVTPVKMTVENLFAVMSCVGLARRAAAERIFTVLCSTSRGKGKPTFVHFPEFFKFVRSLQRGRPDAKATVDGGFATSHKNKHAGSKRSMISSGWHTSGVLQKMMYAVLAGPSPQDKAVMLERTSSTGTMAMPLTISALLETFQRVVLCSPVLLDFGNGPPQLDRQQSKPTVGTNNLSSSAVSGGLLSACVPEAVELLYQELMRAEREISEAFGRIPEAGPPRLSFSGFERFVGRHPRVFMRLMHILLPLAMCCEEVLAEEMEVKVRQLFHKARELKARVDVRIQQMQRKHLLCLLDELKSARCSDTN